MDGGAGGTSWSVAWASILHARLFDAAGAMNSAVTYLSTWVFPSLLSRNGGYFQIDANSGIAAAVIEMLLQSHAGVVHLGPALPQPQSQHTTTATTNTTGFDDGATGMSAGSFQGWVARGGFLVDMAWREGWVTEARIQSLKGNPLAVRVQDGSRAFKTNGKEVADGAALETTVGETYVVSL